MSTWFSRQILMSARSETFRDHRSVNSTPYHLVYHVLKFAKEHRSPIQRSALTYWPSRIDLDKRKYGGPFTIENVKTFLQLLKLLLSLSGILVVLLVATLLYFQELESFNDSQPICLIIDVLCLTATAGLLILCHAFCCFHKCHLSMLKRIGLGAALAITFLLSSLLINSIKYYTNFSKDAQIIISYVNSKYLVQHFPYACYLSPGVHHCSITTHYERNTDWILLCAWIWTLCFNSKGFLYIYLWCS